MINVFEPASRPELPLEIVPVTANADRFALIRDGKAVPGASIVVITPDKWSKTLRADDRGAIELPVREPGRYLLSAPVKTKAEQISRVARFRRSIEMPRPHSWCPEATVRAF